MPILVPKCEKCKSEMLLKQKGSDRFWGCPNYAKCGGKTKPYDGVEKSTENTESSVAETLARIELKLDFLLDNAKQNQPIQSLGLKEIKPNKTIVGVDPNNDFQKLSEILPENEDDIDPKDIPF